MFDGECMRGAKKDKLSAAGSDIERRRIPEYCRGADWERLWGTYGGLEVSGGRRTCCVAELRGVDGAEEVDKLEMGRSRMEDASNFTS